MEKHFTTPDQSRLDSIKLGEKVIKDGFKPDYLVAIWRYGAVIGCYIHELLKYVYQTPVDHIAIRTSRYINPTTTLSSVQVHNLGYLVERLKSDSKVLLVDDVYDSGLSIKAVFDELAKRLGTNMPTDIRVATVDYKPQNNKTDRVPDYYVNITSKWLVFPHELEGLSIKEIEDNMSPEIANIVQSCLDYQNK